MLKLSRSKPVLISAPGRGDAADFECRPRPVIRGPKILPLIMVKVPKIRENLHNSCFAKMLFREKIRGAYD